VETHEASKASYNISPKKPVTVFIWRMGISYGRSWGNSNDYFISKFIYSTVTPDFYLAHGVTQRGKGHENPGAGKSRIKQKTRISYRPQ
jgi:hypothetical protein